MTTNSKRTVKFEKALESLEAIVEKMEEGELTLEQSLKAFEDGVKLSRQCQDALKLAEQKVQLLVERSGDDLLEPFELSADTDGDA